MVIAGWLDLMFYFTDFSCNFERTAKWFSMFLKKERRYDFFVLS